MVDEDEISEPEFESDTGTGQHDLQNSMEQNNMAERSPRATTSRARNDSSALTAGRNVNKSVDQLTDQELANLPRVKNLFNQLWDEKMKQMSKSNNTQGKVDLVHVKSPSDTTIYAPAIVKSPPVANNTVGRRLSGNEQNLFVDPLVQGDTTEVIVVGNQHNMANDMISDFVESVRVEQKDLHEKERRRASEDGVSNPANIELEQARIRSGKATLESEKFKATVAVPKEGIQSFDIPNIGAGVSDDDFFHLTCHIDPNLIHKIKKGEFVELEKLLPKDKLGKTNEENRLEWVQHDGNTFLVPAQKDSKIGSFRRWEQAFRAYATIYCGANPHRSKEI